jgi:hypothetical protein
MKTDHFKDCTTRTIIPISGSNNPGVIPPKYMFGVKNSGCVHISGHAGTLLECFSKYMSRVKKLRTCAHLQTCWNTFGVFHPKYICRIQKGLDLCTSPDTLEHSWCISFKAHVQSEKVWTCAHFWTFWNTPGVFHPKFQSKCPE